MDHIRKRKVHLHGYIIITATILFLFTSFQIEAYAIDYSNLTNELLSCANYSVKASTGNSLTAQLYSVETILTENLTGLHNYLEEQKDTVLALKNKENTLLNPYPILTANNSLSAAYSTTDMGTMYFAGANVHLYYSSAQAIIDAKNSAAVLGPEFGSDPIGVSGGCSIIGDHNYQTGKYFGNLRVGSKIYIKTPYGQFLYQVSKTSYGYTTGPEIYTNDGIGMVTTAKSKGINGIILYTCYPFNSASTSQRYLVFAELIDGTILY